MHPNLVFHLNHIKWVAGTNKTTWYSRITEGLSRYWSKQFAEQTKRTEERQTCELMKGISEHVTKEAHLFADKSMGKEIIYRSLRRKN